ncbi:MAG: hypothetical protein HWQ38_15075 [Nostoc sp. NMS7]|nr:hypothetical protein [Nostoc sp. NMS7]MBN3947704.1 hypothetical protein [Nostoc sp. NMS7]
MQDRPRPKTGLFFEPGDLNPRYSVNAMRSPEISASPKPPVTQVTG